MGGVKMKASELRIGNYLQDRQGRLCQVEAITNNTEDVYAQGFRAPAIKGAVTSIPNSPIPLTDVSLIDLGANGRTNLLWLPVYNLKAELHFECHASGEIVTTLKSQFCDLIFDRIKYIHQLQNLYFALTGQELIYEFK